MEIRESERRPLAAGHDEHHPGGRDRHPEPLDRAEALAEGEPRPHCPAEGGGRPPDQGGRGGAPPQLAPGFGTDLKRGRTALVQILVDGTDSNTAGVVADYASRIVFEYNRDAARAG